MAHQTIFATIYATIDEELNLFTSLFDTLEIQQQQILNRDTASLADTARDITEILEQTRACRALRSKQLQQTGFKNTPEGMKLFCQQQGTPEIQEDWLELIELVEHCKEINLKNGEALRIQRDHSERQLQRIANRQQKTGYSATGQNITPAEPRLQVQA